MALTDKQMVSVWTEKESPPHEREGLFAHVKEWKREKSEREKEMQSGWS